MAQYLSMLYHAPNHIAARKLTNCGVARLEMDPRLDEEGAAVGLA